jgi:hypothetical protein
VICYYPWDLDCTVETKKGRSSPEEVDGETSAALYLHVDVVPAFSGGDGDHDGVQESTARSMAKLRPRSCPVMASRCDWKLDRGRAVESLEENDEQGQI